jgi:hypothetical protein
MTNTEDSTMDCYNHAPTPLPPARSDPTPASALARVPEPRSVCMASVLERLVADHRWPVLVALHVIGMPRQTQN